MPQPSPDDTEPVEPPVRRSPLALRAYQAFGLSMLGLAMAGVVLPGLPATPFLLLAAWAFRRGSPEWAARLDRHPTFGPLLRDWRERRVVPRRAKLAAIVSMAASFALLWVSGASTFVLAMVAAILVIVATYLVTRPSR